MSISRYDFNGIGPDAPPANFAWFHVVLTTYGAWLPGDERGFRTRHHREHVEGDYKSPPPAGMYAKRLQRCQTLLKQPAVRLAVGQQEIVGNALVHRLREQGVFVLTAAVLSQHIHLLVKLPETQTKNWVGAAKRHAWFELRDHGWNKKLWAKRAKFVPIGDRQHLQNTLRYIIAHEAPGAWVWAWEGLADHIVEQMRPGNG